jgi:hypothetical protein
VNKSYYSRATSKFFAGLFRKMVVFSYPPPHATRTETMALVEAKERAYYVVASLSSIWRPCHPACERGGTLLVMGPVHSAKGMVGQLEPIEKDAASLGMTMGPIPFFTIGGSFPFPIHTWFEAGIWFPIKN